MRRYTIAAALLLAGWASAQEDEAAAREQADYLGKRMASRDAEERLQAAMAAAENQHEALTAPLTRTLKDREARVRLAAIAALGRREDPKAQRAAAQALGARIRVLDGRPEDREELLAVLGAMHDLAQPVGIKPLLDDVPHPPDTDVLRARLRAVANVAAPDAIDALIRFGAGGRRGTEHRRALVREALRYATGLDQRWELEAWRQWWYDNRATFNLELAAEQRAREREEKEEKERQRQEQREKREQRQREREKKQREKEREDVGEPDG